MKHFINAVCIGVLTLALSGCGSSPPSDEDVRQAIGEWLQSAFSMGSSNPPSQKSKDEMKKALASVKVINCVKSDAGGFKCDFVGFELARSARFVKSDAGWVYLPQ